MFYHRPVFTLYAKHNDTFYRLTVSHDWAKKHDNGCLISCGLTVGEDMTENSLKSLIRQGKAKEVSKETYNHSGCKSSCVLRGDKICRW